VLNAFTGVLFILIWFMCQASLGHMGMYPYKFLAHRINDMAVVSKGMKPLAGEEKEEKQCACGGTHSQVATGRSRSC
jgi:hypothetical protein